MKPTGLPHSEIPGYASTRLTEAYRSVATSFIGPRRQGIHPAPLLVCNHADQGFGPRPARGRAVNTAGPEVWWRPRSRRRGSLPGEARGAHNADSRNADTACAVSQNMMSTKTYAVGKVPRRERHQVTRRLR
jgi:hypothetical protein